MTSIEARIAERYTAQAREYDALWSPVIRPMAQPLLRAIPLPVSGIVLDVGCGAGSLAPDILALSPGATVVGVDRSEGMLGIARTRAHAVALADARRLPLAGGCADAAVAVFMLHHLPDPIATIAAVAATLRPGGAIGTATWSGQDAAPALDVWNAALDDAGAPPAPTLTDSMDLMDSPEKMCSIFDEVGLRTDRVWTAQAEHRWTPEAMLTLQCRYGRSLARLQALDDETKGRFLAEIRDRFASLNEDAFVWRPIVVFGIAGA